MRFTKYKALVEKSVSAAITAIEIYNKPDCKYREETFATLMVNAWELLLKAKILKENKSNLRSLYVFENKIGTKGNKLKITRPKTNRSGNPTTIGINVCLDKIFKDPLINFDPACVDNIHLLIEIRDNAIHFHNEDLQLGKKVQEIGTASLRNYLSIVKEWFEYDLTKYNFYLMPLSFFHTFEIARSFSINNDKKQVENLLLFIQEKETNTPSDETKDYNISLQLETKFVKSSTLQSLPVRYTKDTDALRVSVHEEDYLKNHYPLDYKDLTDKLKGRYTSFKIDKTYHQHRKRLMSDEKFCKVRLLDPENPKSSKKVFFSAEIIKEFDNYYSKPTVTNI